MTIEQGMGPGQEIVWTALPNGVAADGRGRLSVMASPRLTTPADPPVLQEFDFADWPSAVNAAAFHVFVDGSGIGEAERESHPADSTLWTALFPAKTTWVQPFTFKDFSSRQLRSYPVWSVMNYLGMLYSAIALSHPDDLPPIIGGPYDDLFKHVGVTLGHFRLPHGDRAREQLGEDERQRVALWGEAVESRWQEWRGQHPGMPLTQALGEFQTEYSRQRRFHALDDAFGAAMAIASNVDHKAFGFETKQSMDCYQAHRFFDRPELVSDGVVPPPAVPRLDFHQALGALGDYPSLLRRLGLVVDLLVDIPTSPSARHIRVLPESPNGFQPFNQHRLPQTRFRREGTLFVAAPGGATELLDGVLRLGGAHDRFEEPGTQHWFALVQPDPDGSMLKLVNMASEMQSLVTGVGNGMAGFATPEKTGLPSLRSAGITLYRHERAVTLAERLKDEASRNATNVDDLVHSAEHLVRGYRVDVHDIGENRWYSLCRRTGYYSVTPEGGGPIEVTSPGNPLVDEGYVKASSATSSDAEGSDLYVHEALARWDGWSLVAPRPGRTIEAVTMADGTQEERVTKPDPKAATAFQVNATFKPEAGSLPRLRFGKSYALRVRTVDLAGNSAGLDDARQDVEVVSDPVLYTRWEPIAPPAIVPRAPVREGEAVERMVIRSDFDRSTTEYAEAHQELGYTPENDRHVVPPKISQQMAETHGMFDVAFGPAGDPGKGYATAAREAATLERDENGQLLAGSQTVEGRYRPGAVVAPDPATGAPPPAPGSYLVNTEPRFPLAYLPDVLAGGVTFRGLPGEAVHAEEFGAAWPEREPFIIRLEELGGIVPAGECTEQPLPGQSPLEWFPADRVLAVRLGKGEVRIVRYSCHPTADGLALLAAWQRWIRGTVKEAELTQLAATGGHWMITPFRELVLVHAVARPLCSPSVRLRSVRSPAETFATLEGRAFLSVKSTGNVDLHATWTDQVDSLSDLAPQALAGRAHVTARRVDDWLPEQEPFPSDSPDSNGTLPIPDKGGIPFPFPDMYGKYVGPPVRHEFGDTKHRWVDYFLTGTTRFREYFSPAVTSDPANITRTGGSVKVNVKSSARPDAPRLLYVLPSFRWQPERAPQTWTTFTRTRVGGGLRVWMQRPWYSSGADELLGVVLWNSQAIDKKKGGLSDTFTKLVTQVGLDKTRASGTLEPGLTVGDFGGWVAAQEGLTLDQAPDVPAVDVVGFQPQFDHDRQLWFCDIDLSPKVVTSYFPFVRLALARYQPHSLPGLELSPVVQADFVQLLPSRTLTLTASATTITVTLSGTFAQRRKGMLYPHRIEAAVEDHGAMPGDLGWVQVGKSVSLTPDDEYKPWTGTLDLGRLPARQHGQPPRRVVVREFEVFAGDVDPPATGERVVYADVVELP